MGSFSIWHWLIVLLVVVLIFGTKKLKNIGADLGGAVKGFKDGVPEKIVGEVADLWFHTMVVLAAHGLKPAHVLAELERREGMSGLEEFALRKVRDREQQGD